MALKFDRDTLLERLDPIKYAPEQRQDNPVEQMSLAGSVLALAEVTHQREYEACRAAAIHLLGAINEPEDIQLE